MRTLLGTVALALGVIPATAVMAQTPADPTGHWEGTVTAPMGQIDFEVDVAREASNTLIATYGQKATGVRGLPLTQVALDGRTFTFVLFTGGPGGGAFKGDILPDGKTISGEVKATMGSAPFMLYRTGDAVLAPKVKNTAVSKALEGRWTGNLDVGGTQITIVLTIANRADGTASVLIAQASEPGLQLEAAMHESGSAVSFEVPATSGAWKGTLANNSMTGTWTQPGGSLPLTLTREP
jgi:hypothetical protein